MALIIITPPPTSPKAIANIQNVQGSTSIRLLICLLNAKPNTIGSITISIVAIFTFNKNKIVTKNMNINRAIITPSPNIWKNRLATSFKATKLNLPPHA